MIWKGIKKKGGGFSMTEADTDIDRSTKLFEKVLKNSEHSLEEVLDMVFLNTGKTRTILEHLAYNPLAPRNPFIKIADQVEVKNDQY
jgi:hypothetical protein